MAHIRNAVIFRHSLGDGPGTIADVLSDRGVDMNLIDTFDADKSSFDPFAPDLLVVLGGSCGVYQNDLYPFLKDEMKIVRARIDAGRPVLGICLGAQIIAGSCGERVYVGSNGRELGWYELQINETGRNSPARHFDASLTRVMQLHGDTFDLPPGATLLASTEQYQNQIYSIGTHVLAFQCHVELNARIMKSWCVELAHSASSGSVDLPALRNDTEKFLPLMRDQMRLALNEWLDALA